MIVFRDETEIKNLLVPKDHEGQTNNKDHEGQTNNKDHKGQTNNKGLKGSKTTLNKDSLDKLPELTESLQKLITVYSRNKHDDDITLYQKQHENTYSPLLIESFIDTQIPIKFLDRYTQLFNIPPNVIWDPNQNYNLIHTIRSLLLNRDLYRFNLTLAYKITTVIVRLYNIDRFFTLSDILNIRNNRIIIYWDRLYKYLDIPMFQIYNINWYEQNKDIEIKIIDALRKITPLYNNFLTEFSNSFFSRHKDNFIKLNNYLSKLYQKREQKKQTRDIDIVLYLLEMNHNNTFPQNIKAIKPYIIEYDVYVRFIVLMGNNDPTFLSVINNWEFITPKLIINLSLKNLIENERLSNTSYNALKLSLNSHIAEVLSFFNCYISSNLKQITFNYLNEDLNITYLNKIDSQK